MWLRIVLIFLVCLGSISDAQSYFSNANSRTGINATHSKIPQYYTTGQAWSDYDRDGWLDLYVTSTIGQNTLYRNNGNGTFSVSPLNGQVALANAKSGGAVFGDYNNDGWPDLYVLALGQNTLFRNDGGSGFTDVTTAAGVGDNGKGETAAWGDFDGDSFPDLYVSNWACDTCQTGFPFAGNQDRLYRNNGNGTFSDISDALGIDNLTGAGFVASFLDYDNDGDLDIYLVNDKYINPIGNQLWRNDGPGRNHWQFTDVSEESGANIALFGMGLAVGDYDNDLDLDLYFSNIGPPVMLQNQTSQGNPVFTDVSIAAGVTNNAISWGTFFFDYDNDCWKDIFLAAGNTNVLSVVRCIVYANQQNGSFADVSSISGLNDPLATMGTAYADFNRDGWLDVVVGNHDNGYILYENEHIAGSGNHWISVELTGGGPVNRDAIGSRVYAYLNNGEVLMHEVKSGSSHGAGNQLAAHIGLGSFALDSLKIVWPDGLTETLTNPPVNQYLQRSYPVAGTFLQSLETGWNLIGLPLHRENTTFWMSYRSATPFSLYDFDTKYRSQNRMENYRGYWLHSQTGSDVTIYGKPATAATIHLNSGWNLIAGISGDVPLANVSDPSNIIVPGTLQRYRNGYVFADTIRQGEGYWIKASGNGAIYLDINSAANSAPELRTNALRKSFANVPQIEIRDAANSTQTLYFALPPAFRQQDFSLPPLPPTGAFDARFSDHTFATTAENSHIEWQSANFPLTVSLINLPENQSFEWVEILPDGSEKRQQIAENTTFTISDPDIRKASLQTTALLPERFEIFPNFPNPFNPETHIRFSLPEPATVTITIYSAIGQKIRTLENGHREAGVHSVRWDSRADNGETVASGIYFYRISAGPFSAAKKMMLLR
ncbi:MAG: VCBS repeat-containing protein [Calditrichae bacterium]|nr:VCBS repeat-containing protein [Calditrichia bacterium]